MAAKKIKIGDIAEIKTAAGLAYVQYTHDSEDMGQIVRVLPGLYASRPTDFAEAGGAAFEFRGAALFAFFFFAKGASF
jgi:hypothetical protein